MVQQQSALLQLATSIGQHQQQLHQSMAGDVPTATTATIAFSNRSPINSLRQSSPFPMDSTHIGASSRRTSSKHFYGAQSHHQPTDRTTSSRSNVSGELENKCNAFIVRFHLNVTLFLGNVSFLISAGFGKKLKLYIHSS